MRSETLPAFLRPNNAEPKSSVLTDRQTDRQINRQADRQTDRQADRQAGRQTSSIVIKRSFCTEKNTVQ